MTLRALLAAMAVPLLACAGAQGPRAERVAGSTPPARVELVPKDGAAVFEQAVRAVVRDGYAMRLCDARRLRVRTSPVELEAPCGATTCLARQSVEVKMGYRAAVVWVAREVYDGAERRWRPDREGSEGAARELVARIVGAPRLAPPRNPCAPAARVEMAREARPAWLRVAGATAIAQQ